jgi:bifunctional UDP-N-acetylglucosamine pyrophosphorylase/glucosamine-1-phosphate N-acetyltransferase
MVRGLGVILAAGIGRRMRSSLPKALHRLWGLPMVEYVGRAMRGAELERVIVVVGHQQESVREALGPSYEYVEQGKPLGTGDACRCALPLLEGYEGYVLIAPADTPLVTPEVFQRLINRAEGSGADCVLGVCHLEDPSGYGRVVREDGVPVRVVEEQDATEGERAIREVFTSLYCVKAGCLREILPVLKNENAQGEYYLTDLIEEAFRRGKRVEAERFEDSSLVLGVNDRWQLAKAGEALRERIVWRLCESGVSVVDIRAVYVDYDVKVGPETCLHPMVVLEGETEIGAGCVIGPGSRIRDSWIGDRSHVVMSQVLGARLGEDCRVGPFANVRPGTRVGNRVRIGNYVEIKNSEIGDDVHISHLAYVGDATVGRGTNVGAGTITCNFDGFTKHRTEIGEEAFIGSNVTLVAPVRIGDRAIVAAGSTVNRDVPADALAIGRERQINKEEWAKEWRRRKQGKES